MSEEEKAKEFDDLLERARHNKLLEIKGFKKPGRNFLKEFAEREARPCHGCRGKSKCNLDTFRACLKRVNPRKDEHSGESLF